MTTQTIGQRRTLADAQKYLADRKLHSMAKDSQFVYRDSSGKVCPRPAWLTREGSLPVRLVQKVIK